MMRARVVRDAGWWVVLFDGRTCGRFRYWRDALKQARCVTVLARQGEPTA